MATVLTPPPPLLSHRSSFHQFSVDDYHRMIAMGILDDTDKVELLDGLVVRKMPRNPPHDGTIDLVREALTASLPAGWLLRTQQAITLAHSEPEPDLAVERGGKRSYLARHPGPGEVGLVVEVADSSLDRDRSDKARIYARDTIPVYWIVNLIDGQIEVYTDPSGPSANPGYAHRHDLRPGDSISLVLDGNPVATLPVRELLP